MSLSSNPSLPEGARTIHRRLRRLALLAAFLPALLAPAAGAVAIEYEALSLGGTDWRYEYTVNNDSLSQGLLGFTIFFGDVFLTGDEETTGPHDDWSIQVIPTDALLDPFGEGAFDAADSARIGFGETASGFSIDFAFTGPGAPGAQFFEVWNFDPGFTILETGTTIPADAGPISAVPAPPAGVLFLSALVAFALRSRRTRSGSCSLVTALVIGLALAPLAGPVGATTVLKNVDVELVASNAERIGRYDYRYTFDVIVTSPVDAPGTRGTGTGMDFRAFVESASIGPVDLAAGEPRRFDDAATIIVNRRHLFDPSRVTWAFTSERPPAPVLRIEPPLIDFGMPNLGCGDRETVRLRNEGDAPLTVTVEEIVPDPTESLRFPGTPVGTRWTIAPGGRQFIQLVHDATASQAGEARLRFATNDPEAPSVDFVARGAALGMAPRSDRFSQPDDEPQRLDVLFTADHSGSMKDSLADLDPGFDGIVDALYDSAIDFRATVAVQDSGCPVGPTPWVDRSLPRDVGQATFDTLLANDLITIVDTERLFTIAERALSPENLGPGGCSEGFLRDDADLAIVSVSDEAEQSPRVFSSYVDAFAALKSEPQRFRHHAIAGELPSGCSIVRFDPQRGTHRSVSALAGVGYWQATLRTGGLFLSICRIDWTPVVDTFADGVLRGLTNVFLLEEPAVPGTLRVLVDGLDATEDLVPEDEPSFFPRPPIGELRFEEDAIPPAGSTIDVSYVPRQCP